ncbi:MAG: DUF1080 domain-containing protein [Lacipirellulaceae bacterium]
MNKSIRAILVVLLAIGVCPSVALETTEPTAESNLTRQGQQAIQSNTLTAGFADAAKDADSGESQDSKFVSLFDGSSLSGWIGDKPYWSVRDGVIVGEITPETLIKKNRFLIYQGKIQKDFELIAEYRISQQGNSGINYRSELVEGIDFHALRGYQCDIDGQNRYTGSNYEERGRTTLASIGESMVIPSIKASEKLMHVKRNRWTVGVRQRSIAPASELRKGIKDSKWNEVRIVAKGNVLEHYVNAQLMSKVIDEDEANRKFEGRLGVQVHVGPPMTVEYRNLRVRPLSSAKD